MSKRSTSKSSRTDWARVRALKDAEVDLSDTPEITPEQMALGKLRVGRVSVSRGKTRVNMFLDNVIVQYFKARAGGRGYQTLINDSLVEYIRNRDFEGKMRRVIREEMRRARRSSKSRIRAIRGIGSNSRASGREHDRLLYRGRKVSN